MFHQSVQNQFGKKIKAIRSDRGGEYMSNAMIDYLNKEGIIIQRTAPYSPQQNGVAERKNRTLIEMTRCILFDANMDNRFWGEAVITANFLQNRLPWKNVVKTPHEYWYKRKPIYMNLRRFDSKCFIKVPDEHRIKLDVKAKETILLGFDVESKAYRIDDTFIASNSKVFLNKVESGLRKKFEIEKLGKTNNCLGIRVVFDGNYFLLDQEKYIKTIISKFSLNEAKESDIPLSPTYHRDPCDEIFINIDKYRAAIGCLLYVCTNTRPDIAAAVTILSQKLAKPMTKDWNQVKKLITYLKGTLNLKLKLGSLDEESNLIRYADADWAECRMSRKSNSGYIFLFGGPISWSCKRQNCVTLSSTEAEFVSLAQACKESRWLQRLLCNLNWKGDNCTIIYEDNQSVLKWIETEKYTGRSKHIDVRIHFVKEYIEKKEVACYFCPTENMIADLLTKGLAKDQFQKLRSKIF